MKTDYTLEDWNKAHLSIDRNVDERKKSINRFKMDKDSMILEIGCSDGLNLDVLNLLGHRNVFGVDISHELLTKAKAHRCVCSDACRLGIKSNSLDEIYCRAVLHHINNQDVFSEMVRVLRPGGVIHILEPWPTVFRALADLLTLHVLYRFSRTIYYRKIGLDFEKETYLYWLKNCKKALPGAVAKYNLKIMRRRISLFNVHMTIQKANGRTG